jgi:hypothetical protein
MIMQTRLDPRVARMIDKGVLDSRKAAEYQQQHATQGDWVGQILAHLLPAQVADNRWANEEGGWG